jgi:DNA polymerase III subunit beta
MKVSVLQDKLAKALTTAGRAMPTKTASPILSNILLATEDGRLAITANNQEMAITARIGAIIDVDGQIAVPRTLLELVNTLPTDNRIDLDLDPESLTLKVTCGAVTANINCMNADEFPAMPEMDAATGVEMPAHMLQNMINQVAFSAATDDRRPVLMGVQVRFSANRAQLIAADGFRITSCYHDLEKGADKPLTMLVPVRAMIDLARIIGKETTNVLISLSEGRNQVMFNVGDVEMVSQLIDGNYPDVEALVPKAYTTSLTLQADDFTAACRRAQIFARDDQNTVRLHLEPGSNRSGFMTVRAEAKERGNGEGKLDVIIEGPGLDVAFNIDYLLEAMDVISAEQIVMKINNAISPVLIRPLHAGAEEQAFTHVVMPMSNR